jgi:predicted lipid-binding transport protein (Tim44 family)
MGGGLVGGMIGSLLFRGGGAFGGGGGGGGMGGGPGLLDLAIFGLLGYFIYRMFQRRRQPGYAEGAELRHLPFKWEPGAQPAPDQTLGSEPAGAIPMGGEPEPPDETSIAAVLRTTDSAFDLTRFKEERLDDFFRIQAGFMNRDLDLLRTKLALPLYGDIETDINGMKLSGQINKLENIAVRESRVVEAWQEEGKEYATIRFRANLLDYTVNESNGELVAGSKVEPVKFEEYWTFVHDIGFSALDKAWRLSAIENP